MHLYPAQIYLSIALTDRACTHWVAKMKHPHGASDYVEAVLIKNVHGVEIHAYLHSRIY